MVLFLHAKESYENEVGKEDEGEEDELRNKVGNMD